VTDYELALEEAVAWMDEPGVVAVGEGEEDGRPTVDVWVKPAEVVRRFPVELHGVPVRVRDSGGDVIATAPPDEPGDPPR
jgi:hypothetical protein